YTWEVGFDDVAEDDRVGNLHHGGLHVGREQHALFFGALDLFGQESIQGFGGHESRVDDFAFKDLQIFFEVRDVAVGVGVTNGQAVVLGQGDGLFVGEEVVFAHRGNVCLGVFGPFT